MKKALTILGGLFLALLVAIGCLVGYGVFQGRHLDAESKSYVEATLPRLLADPSANNLVSFFAPQDQEKLNSAEIDQFALKVWAALGRFQSFDDLKGDSMAMYTPSGASIKAEYHARCHYEKGSVTATITLRKTGQSWSLLGLHFDFKTLEPKPTTAARA